jgi:hypothetical protein
MRLVILFTLSLFLSPSLWAAKDAAPKPADAFLFSGAYFTQNFNNDAATAGILALHSDGTLTNSLAGMFCSPGTDGCGLTAPDQGSWKITGENEVSVVFIQFRAPPTGEFSDEPGSVIYKLTWVQTFDTLQNGVFQHFVVTEYNATIFSGGQNPVTDPGEGPYTIFPDAGDDFSFDGQRINVE